MQTSFNLYQVYFWLGVCFLVEVYSNYRVAARIKSFSSRQFQEAQKHTHYYSEYVSPALYAQKCTFVSFTKRKQPCRQYVSL